MIEILVIAALMVLLTAGATAATIGLASLCLWVWQRLQSTMTLPVTDNRILYWPALVAVIWPLLLALLWLLYALLWLPILSDLLFLIFGGTLASLWALSGLVACRIVFQSVIARSWRRGLSVLVLPVTVLLALVYLPAFLKENYTARDYAQFFFRYSSYLSEIEKRPSTEPQFIVWMWGVYDDFGVLYDETDQIASDHPSEAWKKKAENEGVICCRHRHIIGHFYFVGLDMSRGDVRHDVMRGYDLYKSGRIAPGH